MNNPHGWPADPPVVNDAMREQAAAEIVARIVAEYWGGCEIPSICGADLADVLTRACMNGYEIARDLERHHGWDPDAQLVEILDGAGNCLDKALNDARGDWLAMHDIKPPFSDGERVVFDRGRTTGAIDGVDALRNGWFRIIEDGDEDRTRRRIVRFEDCTAEAAKAEVTP